MSLIRNADVQLNPNLIETNPELFGNFFWKLPGGHKRLLHKYEPVPEWFDLNLLGRDYSHLLNRTYLEAWGKGNPQEFIEQGYSLLYLTKKIREFFEDVDESIVKTGDSIERIRQMNFENWKIRKTGLGEMTNIHHKELIPVYLSLRSKGYNHYDLFA